MRGTTLGDRYRLGEWLGGGSMGDVWLAEDQVLDRRVAVKILKPALLDEPGFAERFHDEARVMARLRHPGIVGVHDFGPGRTAEDVPSWGAPTAPPTRPVAYLVMELITGEPLSTVLERRGPLTVLETLGLALEVLAALQAAHGAGIVHRDIKPANLMVRDGHVVITDFGIARPGCDARLTVPGMVLGTAAYQAPEQASTGTVTASADLYALGVVLYECLTGRLPFEGGTALELILKHLTDPVPPLPADVPAPVRAVVEGAMAKDPALRWPDAAAMASAVRAALAGAPVAGPPPTGTLGGAAAGAAAVRPTGAAAVLRPTGTGAGTGTGARAGAGTGPGTGTTTLGRVVFDPAGSIGTGSLLAGTGPHPLGTAARELLLVGTVAPPKPATGWRAALFGTRRRALLVTAAAVLCCVVTAGTAVVLHQDGKRAAAVTGAAAAGSTGDPVRADPLSAASAGPASDPGTASPSPAAPSPSASLPPGTSGAPLAEAGAGIGAGAVGGAVGGTGGPGAGSPGAPAGRDTVPNASGTTAPGAPGGPAAPQTPGSAAGGPGAPGTAATNPPERPSTPSDPVYTAAPPPGDPAYTTAPRRTVPPVYTTSTLPPAPVYTPPAPYTPPAYTAGPPYPTPPIKPPTQQPGPLPPRARLSNAGAVLYNLASLDRDGNPVVVVRDDGGPGGVWQLAARAGGGYSLLNGSSRFSKVLDLEENHALTMLSQPVPDRTKQAWTFVPVSGGYLLSVLGDALHCLSAVGPNTPAMLRTCEASADQIWTVTTA
ncbi:serine/threonine protein kinase [Kitasatospora purpeofusca]|uniref:serine/threonine protein kinase n=1 Tax=Kitasatospora purpeofusca TaxID=67352 RepID=UPI0022571013|nr:serine/threonine-protein kinase [Kitasatospora purpeofusca]MCX4757941.1 protein kinase [Kitasatospora purpeofusca]WSR31576.1 protein kinase [Kitasatospora purpeofusca]